MSWLEKIKTDLQITTGDKKVYLLSWIPSAKSKEYNVSEFDFKDISGTLVHREKPRGIKFDLTIIFQGENHLEEAQRFENSADNPNFWIIEHPYYGTLKVQPISIIQDNTDANVSLIGISLFQTIDLSEELLTTASVADEVKATMIELMPVITNSYATNEPLLSIKVKGEIKQNSFAQYKKIVGQIKNTTDSNKYINSFNNLTSKLTNIGSDAVDIAASLQRFSTMPYSFIDSVYDRIKMLGLQYDIIKNNITNLGSRVSKRTFEMESTSILINMAGTAVQYVNDNIGSFSLVIQIIDSLIEYYNDLIAKLDDLKTDNNGDVNSYSPDFVVLFTLSKTIDKTIVYLIKLAKNSKTKRNLVLTEDCSIHKLTSDIYGLDSEDNNIFRLIEDNNIGLSELLILKKGRQIIYYK